jgi:excisionase family DNA binding protein
MTSKASSFPATYDLRRLWDDDVGVNTMKSEPWVTAEHVAQHLGVVTETIYRWRQLKGLPAHKIGRLWKFQLPEIDSWVRAGGAEEICQNNGRRGGGAKHMAPQTKGRHQVLSKFEQAR